jgi:hypothetical protein
LLLLSQTLSQAGLVLLANCLQIYYAGLRQCNAKRQEGSIDEI